MIILGISAYYHDSAAALIRDGHIVAAAQEERFSRVKHDPGFPVNAIGYCLDAARMRLDQVDRIAYYEKPFLKFERLLETYLAFAPRGFPAFCQSLPAWLREKLFLKDLLVRELAAIGGNQGGSQGDETDWAARLLFSEHHLSHAASAFYPSPFQDAVILTMDGVGEWCTTSLAVGHGKSISIEREIHFPHSLGLLYSAFTYYTGFRVNSGEYKLMGLAPYGEPRFARLIRDHLVDIRQDGSFHLDLSYFDYCAGLRMTNARFDALFGGPARTPESPLTQRHMDLAASIQIVTEEIVQKLVQAAAREHALPNLCLAGGVALNCVANGKLLRDGAFENMWIQPAAGDAGGALGAALFAHHALVDSPRLPDPADSMCGGYLGPEFSDADIACRLKAAGARFDTLSPDELIAAVARDLAEGRAVGWFQGRMEFGPRALGGRSILGDARSPSMQRTLNLKVKFRESFRPFAPSVLREHAGEWFDLAHDSPYMLIVADVAGSQRIAEDANTKILFGIDRLNLARSTIPAVTHVDYSARVQTVHAETNPRYHALITAFHAITGCPVIVNTSFNVRGEPIVGTPEDAFRCFMGTDIDTLAIGNCLLRKDAQDSSLRRDYRAEFVPD